MTDVFVNKPDERSRTGAAAAFTAELVAATVVAALEGGEIKEYQASNPEKNWKACKYPLLVIGQFDLLRWSDE